MRKIAKRAISLLCVFSILFSMLVVRASSDIKFIVGSLTVEKGIGTEIVDVPITISNNTGIIGMTLTVEYGEGLTLTSIEKGNAFPSLTMTKPGDFSANPVKITWDGESENDNGNGEIVKLSFIVPKNIEKEYYIEINVSGVVDENLSRLPVSTENGKISVGGQLHVHSHGNWVKDNDTTHTKTCVCGDKITEDHNWDNGVVTLPATQTTTGIKAFTCSLCIGTKIEIIPKTDYDTEKINLVVGSITVEKGTNTDVVEVPIAIFNNTGIIGMTLTVNYDEELTLTDISKGSALSSLTMTKPGDFSANPIKITWDGEDKNDIENGTVATLLFNVPKDTEKEYPIEITVSGVIDENLNRLNVETDNGKIIVNTPSSPDDTILDSGKDSNGIQWTLYETGMLVFSGSGAMSDYSKVTEIPWYGNRLSVTEVIIDKNITHIANRAFYGCIYLSKITIPKGVNSIGTYAFKNCDEMTIYGESGSFAEEYAIENDIPFVNTKMKDMILEYAATSKKMYFDILVEDYSGDATAYVALYDADGRMIDLASETLLPDDITSLSLNKNSNASYAKVFVLGNEIKPVTKAEIISDL